MLYPDSTYKSHFGVYALVFNAAKDKLLLIKKTRGCYDGRYDMPGGGMEPHEMLEETLTREVFEETGCYVTNARQIGAFSVHFPFAEEGKKCILRHLGAIYTAEISGTPMQDINNDGDLCAWVALTDLSDKNTTPLTLAALKAHAGK
jgi:ADP-ribose pyrophosphatase YjhB (NUDIX family)